MTFERGRGEVPPGFEDSPELFEVKDQGSPEVESQLNLEQAKQDYTQTKREVDKLMAQKEALQEQIGSTMDASDLTRQREQIDAEIDAGQKNMDQLTKRIEESDPEFAFFGEEFGKEEEEPGEEMKEAA